MDNNTQPFTKGKLQVDGDYKIVDEAFATVANTGYLKHAESLANAAEIVKRWNVYDELIECLDKIVGSMALERTERFDLNDKAKQLLNQLK